MIYILKTEINENSNILSGLCKIYGMGMKTSKQVIKIIGLNKNVNFKNLDNKFREKLIQIIEDKFLINNDLKKEILKNKELLLKIKTYRGIRDRFNLPRRGQRTHTNAKTTKKIK